MRIVILILFKSTESVLRIMIFEIFLISCICSYTPWYTALIWLSATTPWFWICTLPSELKCWIMWSEIIKTLELFRIALLWHPFFLSVNTLNTSLLFHLLVESERLMMGGGWGGFLVAALEIFISLCDRLPARLENRRGRSPSHIDRCRTILLFLRLDMRECIFK
jgi:hypothetical protein